MTAAEVRADRERATRGLWVRYIIGLGLSNTLAAIDTAVVLVLLYRGSEETDLLTTKNIVVLSIIIVAGAIGGSALGAWIVFGSLRWFASGEPPTPAQRRAALQMSIRETGVHIFIWITGGAAFIIANLEAGPNVIAMIALAVLFGGSATACMGYLVTERTLRPVIAAAMSPDLSCGPTPGVHSRLMITWLLCTALPTSAIAFIVIAKFAGFIIPTTAETEVPIVLLTAVSLIAGFRATRLVSRSVSDPVGEVGAAMGAVETGRIDTRVDVYDSSEIGRLQTGFNKMVAGLAERERLRDLFGRHVGHDVARRAIEQDALLSGDVREAAVLFIDLVGSTTLAATQPPDAVAAVLNDFFRIVVAAVDDHHGLINKFEGDAALAIFGAPLAIDDSAGAALSTARRLQTDLRVLHGVDFGIGVSAGKVFAGNIGAENRYEYTVIGDPVNEAARLTDLAKSRDGRVLAAQVAIDEADRSEADHWRSCGSTVLRGRTASTEYSEPL